MIGDTIIMFYIPDLKKRVVIIIQPNQNLESRIE